MRNRPIVGFLALVIGLVLCASGLWLLFSPTQYQATVKIEIEPDYVSDGPYNDGTGYAPYDPYFMETQLKMIYGEIVLSNVVQSLDLDTAWGKQTDETIKLLRRHMALELIQNTKLVQISVWDGKPDEAAKIANAIAKAYLDYRIELHRQNMDAGMAVLYKDYSNEEVQIELMQSNVDQLRKQYKINDPDPNSTEPSPTITVEQMQHLNETLIEGKATYIKSQNEYNEFQTIQATNPVVLADVLLTINPDNTLSILMEQLREKERDLAVETNQFAAQSPELTSTRAVIDKLHQQIADRVNGIMIGYKSKVEAQKAQFEALQQVIQNVKDEIQAKAKREAPYWDAWRALLDKRKLHYLLSQKIESIKKDANIALPNLVTIVDPAVPPPSPGRPNRWLGAGLFICGLILVVFGVKSLRFGLENA